MTAPLLQLTSVAEPISAACVPKGVSFGLRAGVDRGDTSEHCRGAR